ncbi:amidohydrolase family protein [Streptomyces sp. NPDC060223]|uniref:amidohydrolase family protein n=1 Tax=unclassified Streptomyces TaxID=2593676 RepID=UPI0036447E49
MPVVDAGMQHPTLPVRGCVALGFPELTIVCGHIGYPWTTEMIAVADKHAGVYTDTSAYTARSYPPELVEYLRGRGRRKVLFGSNHPMITPHSGPGAPRRPAPRRGGDGAVPVRQRTLRLPPGRSVVDAGAGQSSPLSSPR